MTEASDAIHDSEARRFFLTLEEDQAYLMYRQQGTVMECYSRHVPTD